MVILQEHAHKIKTRGSCGNDQGKHLGMKFLPTRIPILYTILSVLVVISVVPMFFYSMQVQSTNRESLITNERLLQNTITVSVAFAEAIWRD